MATIRKRKGKYEVQVRRIGQPHISRSFIERKDAQQWARLMEIAADRHDLPTTVDRKALAVTLGALIHRYRETVVVKKKAHRNENIALSAFSLHPICRKTIAELRTSDFAEYRDQRLKTVKPISLKRELAPIRHMFSIAKREWGIPIKDNPLENLRFEASDQRRERRLKPGEYERLVASANKSRNRLILPLFRFAVETGMRRGEMLNIRRGDIDAANSLLFIPESKNGQSRTIPLTAEALEILQQRLAKLTGKSDRDLVFPISGNCLRLAWERVRRRAKCDDLRWHDLRHESLSRLFELGLTAPEVRLISGHRTASCLFRYAHAERTTIAAKLAASGATTREATLAATANARNPVIGETAAQGGQS